jgi:hypothetical protein
VQARRPPCGGSSVTTVQVPWWPVTSHASHCPPHRPSQQTPVDAEARHTLFVQRARLPTRQLRAAHAAGTVEVGGAVQTAAAVAQAGDGPARERGTRDTLLGGAGPGAVTGGCRRRDAVPAARLATQRLVGRVGAGLAVDAITSTATAGAVRGAGRTRPEGGAGDGGGTRPRHRPGCRPRTDRRKRRRSRRRRRRTGCRTRWSGRTARPFSRRGTQVPLSQKCPLAQSTVSTQASRQRPSGPQVYAPQDEPCPSTHAPSPSQTAAGEATPSTHRPGWQVVAGAPDSCRSRGRESVAVARACADAAARRTAAMGHAVGHGDALPFESDDVTGLTLTRAGRCTTHTVYTLSGAALRVFAAGIAVGQRFTADPGRAEEAGGTVGVHLAVTEAGRVAADERGARLESLVGTGAIAGARGREQGDPPLRRRPLGRAARRPDRRIPPA